MPAPSKPTQARRRALGDGVSKLTKPDYSPELQLNDDHPCAPSFPPVFTPTNADLWSDCWAAETLTPLKRHGSPVAGERPPQKRQPITNAFKETAPGISHGELNRLSQRAYSLRASDASDFASAWETSIVPLLHGILQQHYIGDFAIDVHNFPEMSSDAVPRVIYITLSGDADTTGLEQSIGSELRRAVPERFSNVYLKFRKGAVRRSYWGTEGLSRDDVCEPKNVTFRPTPVMGMSIGPVKVPDAASLGGFVGFDAKLWAMSAFHAFQDSIDTGQLQVCHPATPDVAMIVPQDARAEPYSIGTLAMWSKPGTLRPSLTFQDTDFAHDLTKVEMDYCLIGPVPNGCNFVTVPSFQMDRSVAVQNTAAVEGNTEVYAMARTSGYSLGFTSDVPGLQSISGQLRREWTVRQYAPSAIPHDDRPNPPWQTVKQWVTSGIGVPGDSGAWLIRRSDNAVMGLIWGRNLDQGNPVERVRLTYFTPIVDILADVQPKLVGSQQATLPVYSAGDLARDVNVRGSHEVVQVDMSEDPWTVPARSAIRRRQINQAELIRRQFSGDERLSPDREPEEHDGAGEALAVRIPPVSRSSTSVSMANSVLAVRAPTTPARSASRGSVAFLGPQEQLLLGMELNPGSGQLLPGLSSSPSTNSASSMSDETSEVASAGVRVEGEDRDIMEVEEPIRMKASFAPKYPNLLALNHMPLRVGRPDLGGLSGKAIFS